MRYDLSNPLQLYSGMTNRFKGFDMTDRVPEELWTDACNTVQEAVIRTILKKQKLQKGKMVV